MATGILGMVSTFLSYDAAKKRNMISCRVTELYWTGHKSSAKNAYVDLSGAPSKNEI
jgi:hypothetical protein